MRKRSELHWARKRKIKTKFYLYNDLGGQSHENKNPKPQLDKQVVLYVLFLYV